MPDTTVIVALAVVVAAMVSFIRANQHVDIVALCVLVALIVLGSRVN